MQLTQSSELQLSTVRLPDANDPYTFSESTLKLRYVTSKGFISH